MLPYSALMTLLSARRSWVWTKNARPLVSCPHPQKHFPVGSMGPSQVDPRLYAGCVSKDVTPKQLAAELGVRPQTVRQWLRGQGSQTVPYTRWRLSPDQVSQGTPPLPRSSRRLSDASAPGDPSKRDDRRADERCGRADQWSRRSGCRSEAEPQIGLPVRGLDAGTTPPIYASSHQ